MSDSDVTLYMLDTNIVSELVKEPSGPVADRIARVGESSVCCSIVVAAELRFGAEKSGSVRIRDRVEGVLSALDVIALDAPADTAYATVRASLESRGETIGPNDLLIAAHALSEGAILVTANEGEFRRVDGLGVENWLSAR